MKKAISDGIPPLPPRPLMYRFKSRRMHFSAKRENTENGSF